MIANRPLKLARMSNRRGMTLHNGRVAELAVRLAPLALALQRTAAERAAKRPRFAAVGPRSALRREVRRAVEEMEFERRQARRRWLLRSLAASAFAAAMAGGASRRRGHA